MAMNHARLVATSKAAMAPSASSAIILRSWNLVAAPVAATSRSCVVGGPNNAGVLVLPSAQQRRCCTSSINSNNQQHLSSQHQFFFHNGHQQQQRRYFARGNKRGGSKYRGDQQFDRYTFDDNRETTPKETKNILVIGSSGILGKTLVSHFGTKHSWNVLGADILMDSSTKGDKYIQLPKDGSMAELTAELYRGVSIHLQGGNNHRNKLDAIVCASGGWAGDVDMADMMENHLADANNSSGSGDVDMEEEYARQSAEVCERMMRMNYFPIVAGSQVGRRFMKRGGECYDVDFFLCICNNSRSCLFGYICHNSSHLTPRKTPIPIFFP